VKRVPARKCLSLAACHAFDAHRTLFVWVAQVGEALPQLSIARVFGVDAPDVAKALDGGEASPGIFIAGPCERSEEVELLFLQLAHARSERLERAKVASALASG